MQQLEKELQVPLFRRTKNRLELNEFGIEAAQSAEALLQQEKEIVLHLQEMYLRNKVITIASFVPELSELLASQITSFYPERSIVTEKHTSEQLLAGLNQQQFDYVISEYSMDEPDITCIPYLTDRLLLRVHKLDSLFENETISFSNLAQQKILVLDDHSFWSSKIRRHLSHRLDLIFVKDQSEYAELLSAFHMRSFTLSSQSAMNDTSSEFRVFPLPGEEIAVPFYLCCLKKNDQVLQAYLNGGITKESGKA